MNSRAKLLSRDQHAALFNNNHSTSHQAPTQHTIREASFVMIDFIRPREQTVQPTQ